jgi:hypothetical protein
VIITAGRLAGQLCWSEPWTGFSARTGDTSAFIRQAPAGAGLLIEITAKTAAEHDALTITLDGRTLHPATPAGGQRA